MKDGDPELADFCLQQAVEKFLKPFLLSKNWKLRHIHDLDALLDDAINYEKSLEKFRDVCEKISGFYFVERYPLMLEAGISEEDVHSAIIQVSDFVDWIRKNLPRKNG